MVLVLLLAPLLLPGISVGCQGCKRAHGAKGRVGRVWVPGIEPQAISEALVILPAG